MPRYIRFTPLAAGPVSCAVRVEPATDFLDDVGDPAESLVQLGCPHPAGQDQGQEPGFVVLAGHRVAQRGRVDEVLQQDDVAGVGAQIVGQGAVGGQVGRVQPVVVGQDDQQDVLVSDPDW